MEIIRESVFGLIEAASLIVRKGLKDIKVRRRIGCKGKAQRVAKGKRAYVI